MDNAPDYSKYSPRELRDVAARVDRTKFPERHALALREIARRESAGDDAATATRSKPVTVWNLVSVLFAAAGGALLGAILSGCVAYVMNPPYGAKYGDGIGWGLGFIGCVFLGAIVGGIVGLIWSVNKVHRD